MEVCNRRLGPDYLEVHAVAHESTSCSTSSWLLERPAAMSARPRRMDAMMCNSSGNLFERCDFREPVEGVDYGLFVGHGKRLPF